MTERELRDLIAAVKAGEVSRRVFVRPMIAAEIPETENGGISPDGKSVTWKLKKDVQWHDGRPFTADDVVFNWEYAADPATAATTIGSYKDIKVEKVDTHTVRIQFDKP